MKSKLITLLLVTGLVAQTQSLAAENAYCSKESASERWLSDQRNWLMNNILIIIASKAECSLLTDADIDALHSFHETRGCSRDTPFGEYIQSFVDGDNAARLNEMVFSLRRRTKEDLATYCARYGLIELPANIVPLIEGVNQAKPDKAFTDFWEKHR